MAPSLVDRARREMMIETGILNLVKFMNLVRHNEIEKVEKRLNDPDMQAIGGANIWDDSGQYPVHVAAAEGHTEMLRMLVDRGADIDQMTNGDHRTALHYAVINKDRETIRYLVDMGAKTDVKDVNKKTPRMYATDEDMMRIVFEGETINKNLNDLQDVMQRLMKMNNTNIRKPRTDENQRMVKTYDTYATEMEAINEQESLTLPIPVSPGPSVAASMISQMRRRNHGEYAFLCTVPRDEFSSFQSKPFSGIVRLRYTEWLRGEPAVELEDIYVSRNNRRHYWGSMLLASALSYVVVGPHPPPKRVFKVFCCVPEQNALANAFFHNAGFLKQPAHNIPPRLRLVGVCVYMVKHAGIALAKVTNAMRPGLNYNGEWVTSEQAKAEEEKRIKEFEERDMAVFNKRFDAFFAEPPVPRLASTNANVAGEVVIPLGIGQPPDQKREADRKRVLRILEKRKEAAYTAANPTDKREKPKEPHVTCENDRVPEDILRANSAAVFRMRDLNRWKQQGEARKINNSRILACPDILRDCWLDELEYDALLAIPDDWVKRRDADGQVFYFNKNTKKSTPSKPTRKFTLESRTVGAGSSDAKKEDDEDDDDAFFDGQSLDERKAAREEEEKRSIRERRLWERDMDSQIDKALQHSESVEGFVKKMMIKYSEEVQKRDEIVLRARQALTAAGTVESAKPKTEEVVGKKGMFGGLSSMFKTPLEQAIEVRKEIEKQNAAQIAEKLADSEMKGERTQDSRPSSATVSAAAFGTPTRRSRAMLDADSLAPAGFFGQEDNTVDGKINQEDQQSLGSPKKRAKPDHIRWKKELEELPAAVKSVHGHLSADDWIQREAEIEQARQEAINDADCMLDMFAPPPRTQNPDSSKSHSPHSVSDGRQTTQTTQSQPVSAECACGHLSTVIESPVAGPPAHGSYFGQDADEKHSGGKIVPFNQVSQTKRPHSGTSVARLPSACSAASTHAHSHGPSSASSSLHGLDGVSRPASTQGELPCGIDGGLDGASRPPSSESHIVHASSNIQLFKPWGSHLLGLQSSSAVISQGHSGSRPLPDLFQVSRPSSVSSIQTSDWDSVSRPGSRTDSRPMSRETASRPISGASQRPTEWMVPWRIGGERSFVRAQRQREANASSVMTSLSHSLACPRRDEEEENSGLEHFPGSPGSASSSDSEVESLRPVAAGNRNVKVRNGNTYLDEAADARLIGLNKMRSAHKDSSAKKRKESLFPSIAQGVRHGFEFNDAPHTTSRPRSSLRAGTKAEETDRPHTAVRRTLRFKGLVVKDRPQSAAVTMSSPPRPIGPLIHSLL